MAADVRNKSRLYLILLILIVLAVGSYFYLSSDGVTEGLYDDQEQVETAPEVLEP